MTSKQKFKLFDSVDSIEAAKKAAQQGTVAAALVAVFTSVLAIISIANSDSLGEGMPQINAWAFWDVGFFVAIALGIHKLSRVAAVAGLLLYAIEQMIMRVTNPSLSKSGLLIMVLFLLAFINGVRGTFAYHTLRQQQDP